VDSIYMKSIILLFFSIGLACAAPTVSTIDWNPACDGSSIEIVKDGARVLGVQASAFHSEVIVSWSIHYMDGKPFSAEFRELARGRIQEGDKAGEPSGDNPIQRVVTCGWKDGTPQVSDKDLKKDLLAILAKVSASDAERKSGRE